MAAGTKVPGKKRRSEFVKPYLEESKFWNNLWESAGKPSIGDLSSAKKQSKQQYKYAVRRLKRAGVSIQNNKFGKLCPDKKGGSVGKIMKQLA